MKNIIIAVLALTTVVAGSLCWQQTGRARKAENTAAAMDEDRTALKNDLAEQAQRLASLQERYKESVSDGAAKTAQIAQLRQGNSNSTPAAAKPLAPASAPDAKPGSSPIAEMMKSPEMRDMIKAQQKLALGPLVEKNYGGLIASLQLSPNQATTLKDLITKKVLIDADMGTSMVTGEMDSDKRKELVDQARASKAAIDDQIKQFLGDQYYSQYKDYEKTQPERTVVASFKDQLGSGANAMSADQEQQLLGAMNAERQAFKFTTDYSDQSQFTGDFNSYFTEERLDQFGKESAQLAQRYLTRAQGILSADQFTSFQNYLTTQQQMQQTAMKMAAKMFAPAAK